MTITTLSSREFNQDASAAKKAAERGPVFITDGGRPAHVLLTIEEYRRISDKRENIMDLLAMPDTAEVEFEPLVCPAIFTALPISPDVSADTNVVSQLIKSKSGRVHRHVRAWAKSVSAATLFLSVICIMELEIGILLIERRDQAQGALLRSWMDNQILPTFKGRVFPIVNPWEA